MPRLVPATRPYTPRTNGTAESFIQTALREWAYAKPYRSSWWRADALTRHPLLQHATPPQRHRDVHPSGTIGCATVNNVFVVYI